MSVPSVITSDSVKTTRTACDPSTAETLDHVRKRPGATALNTRSRIINAPINPYFSTCRLRLPNEWLFGVIDRSRLAFSGTRSYRSSGVAGVQKWRRIACYPSRILHRMDRMHHHPHAGKPPSSHSVTPELLQLLTPDFILTLIFGFIPCDNGERYPLWSVGFRPILSLSCHG